MSMLVLMAQKTRTVEGLAGILQHAVPDASITVKESGVADSEEAVEGHGPRQGPDVGQSQPVGIEMTQTREGVQVRLSDRVLFDFDKSFLRPDSGPRSTAPPYCSNAATSP